MVVVQHHPVLQRKGDKAVQLFCFFAAQDKVVTNSYDVLAGWDLSKLFYTKLFVLNDRTIDGVTSPTSIVNATASSPGVRLRIVTDDGDDISGEMETPHKDEGVKY